MELILPTIIPLLRGHFSWNLARTRCRASLIVALIKVRTVNLVQRALALPGNAIKESKYRRLQRLFEQFSRDFSWVARLIASQLPYDKYTLTMDRAHWKFGTTHINILFLAIVHKGIAIPILWVTLDEHKKKATQIRLNVLR